LKVDGAFRGIDVKYGEYAAERVGFDLAFDAGGAKVDVKRFQLEAPGGGRLDLDARLHTDTLKLDLDLRVHDLATAGYLPPAMRALGGGRLGGRMVARGDLAAKSVNVKELDFQLARTRAGGLPAT